MTAHGVFNNITNIVIIYSYTDMEARTMSDDMVANHVLLISPLTYEKTEYSTLTNMMKLDSITKDNMVSIDEQIVTALKYLDDKGIQFTTVTKDCIYVKKVSRNFELFSV